MKLKKFLEQKNIKKAQALVRPDKNKLVANLVQDLEDGDSKPKHSPDSLPSATNILKKQDPANKMKQQSYDAKVAQANASQGIYPKSAKSPLVGFMQRKRF